MRLWHKDLITVLPSKFLYKQFKDCCRVASRLVVQGKVNNIMVERISDYPIVQLDTYTLAIKKELNDRRLYCEWKAYTNWRSEPCIDGDIKEVFLEWHDDRYLNQCYYILEEMYDCGGISEEEWDKIYNCEAVKKLFKEGNNDDE